MARSRRRRKLQAASEHNKPLTGSQAAITPRIHLMAYSSSGEFAEMEIEAIADLKAQLNKFQVMWLNVDGIGNGDFVREVAELFDLHELALEDVLSLQQRAKVEQYDDHLFIVLRMITMHHGEHPETEQLSLFLGKRYVLTFQEHPGGDTLGPVRERIRRSLGRIRTEPSDYLAYALIDAAVDGYFPVLELLGEKLDQLEDEILDQSTGNETPARVHEIKRDILLVRRAIWPLREAVNNLIRDANPLISDQTRVYLRDVHDHAMRIMDLVEMYREIGSDLMDLYLTSVSNRMNEVMKALTLITSIFIPPTLIAGIYGMNFDTRVSPWNMPELNWYYGYPLALSIMVLLSLLLIGYLWHRGWLTDKHNPKTPANSAKPQSS
jgi:magnesium transporter